MMIVTLFPLPTGSFNSISSANPTKVIYTWLYGDSVATDRDLQALYQILIN